MGVKSTHVRFLDFRETIILKPDSGSILKHGSRLAIKLSERKSYVVKKVRAEASVSFDECQRLILLCPGELKGKCTWEVVDILRLYAAMQSSSWTMVQWLPSVSSQKYVSNQY